MNTRQLFIVSFLALGVGAAMQAAQARELPEGLRAFALEQQQIIMLQGEVARNEIQRDLWKDYERARVAFIDSQERAIKSQASVALADIKKDLTLIRFEGRLARLMPRPFSKWHPDPPLIILGRYYDR